METTFGVGWAKQFWNNGDAFGDTSKFTPIITSFSAFLLLFLFCTSPNTWHSPLSNCLVLSHVHALPHALGYASRHRQDRAIPPPVGSRLHCNVPSTELTSVQTLAPVFGFFWIIPNMCRKMYVAKQEALAASRKEIQLLQGRVVLK